jgi:hypothetical protein
MSMSGMGMDMGSDGMFRPENQKIANAFWYIVVAAVACGFVVNLAQKVNERIRLWQKEARSIAQPTVPRNSFSQAYHTALAVGRELAYPQGVYFNIRGLRWLSPQPLGRILIGVSYWIIIFVMITNNAVVHG